MSKSRLAPSIAIFVWAGPALALAAPPVEHTTPPVLKSVLDCRGIADNGARLACYDTATAKFGQAEEKGDVVVIDRAQAQRAHREAFGLSVPSLAFVTRALAPGDVNQVKSRIKSARSDGYGHWTFVLEDGAVWRQISGDLGRDPKPGQEVTVQRGTIGSFKMSINGGATIKVHRDE